MIELPRACVRADEIAEFADFFSFGTNDLTQTALGFSRDDAEGKFLTHYLQDGILKRNPFETLDQSGVGDLMRIAVERATAVKDIKMGICGEHGGEPASVAFCHRLGLDYVSCSPYRVPVARLAAAQAALAEAGVTAAVAGAQKSSASSRRPSSERVRAGATPTEMLRRTGRPALAVDGWRSAYMFLAAATDARWKRQRPRTESPSGGHGVRESSLPGAGAGFAPKAGGERPRAVREEPSPPTRSWFAESSPCPSTTPPALISPGSAWSSRACDANGARRERRTGKCFQECATVRMA